MRLWHITCCENLNVFFFSNQNKIQLQHQIVKMPIQQHVRKYAPTANNINELIKTIIFWNHLQNLKFLFRSPSFEPAPTNIEMPAVALIIDRCVCTTPFNQFEKKSAQIQRISNFFSVSFTFWRASCSTRVHNQRNIITFRRHWSGTRWIQ